MVATVSHLPRVREGRVALSGISWEVYEGLVDDLERSGRRCVLTYDQGDLEVEMPSDLHQFVKKFVSDMLTIYFLARQVRFLPAGQTTFKRRLIQKGLEADETYYLTGFDRIDASASQPSRQLPAPDLAIEVEVTEPLMDKLPVYAGIGVGELWHIDLSAGEPVVRILLLQSGAYVEQPASAAVPHFTAELLRHWVTQRLASDHFDALQAFRATLATT
jgi:Uma2 family endonuclease